MLRVVGGILLAVLGVFSASAQADVFSVAKPQFSRRVLDDGSYTAVDPAVNGSISRGQLDQGRVYFSFTLLGEDRAIEYVKARGRLDVYAIIFADGVRRDTISVGIDQQKWKQVGNKILQKFEEEGYFTWRTYMYTDQTTFSSIEILVRDGSNNVIGRATLNIEP